MTSATSVSLHLARKEFVILGKIVANCAVFNVASRDHGAQAPSMQAR